MPLALQYGMTYEQYWHGDPNLLGIYYKSYLQKLHHEAYIHGYYVFEALRSVVVPCFNTFGGKKDKIEYLKQPLITAESYNKKQITKENVNQENRRGLQYQNNWLNALSANK